MSILKVALESGKFGVTAEMAPPKGYDFTEQMEAAELLKGKVHGVNVTDMQSASLKATGLGLCIKLKQAGVEPILQMTGRDRNRMALMGDALAAYSFGIDTMLALTGDHPVVGLSLSVVSDSCHPTDGILPASSVHRILQARILKWAANSFSRGSSRPRDQTRISCTGR